MILVLEMSGHVRSSEVEIMSDFVLSLLQRMRVERDVARIGLVRYGSTVTHMRYLNTDIDDRSYYSRIENTISELRYETSFGDADTSSALKAVLDEQLVGNRGYRTDVSTVVLMITSSPAIDYRRAISNAEALHDVNVRLITIGVGELIDRQNIYAYSSEGYGRDTAYFVSRYSGLSNVIDAVTESICVYQAPPPRPSPTLPVGPVG